MKYQFYRDFKYRLNTNAMLYKPPKYINVEVFLPGDQSDGEPVSTAMFVYDSKTLMCVDEQILICLRDRATEQSVQST